MTKAKASPRGARGPLDESLKGRKETPGPDFASLGAHERRDVGAAAGLTAGPAAGASERAGREDTGPQVMSPFHTTLSHSQGTNSKIIILTVRKSTAP